MARFPALIAIIIAFRFCYLYKLQKGYHICDIQLLCIHLGDVTLDPFNIILTTCLEEGSDAILHEKKEGNQPHHVRSDPHHAREGTKSSQQKMRDEED